MGDSLVSSPTATTFPTAVPIAVPTADPPATDPQRAPSRRQSSILPPRRRDSQPPATPRDTEVISGLSVIDESAAKDDKRLIKRLVKLIEGLNKTVQGAERDFDLAHNAKGGEIRMPDSSHDHAIHQAVRELLQGSDSSELRRFQETSVKMNQIIEVSRVVMGVPYADTSSGNTT
jgi:hypothetical protein